MEKHGVLLVDKPEGMTSHTVVAQVRRWLGQKSVGHAGTLDPLATGLLVLLVGKATKISDYLLNGDKGYRVRVRLGCTTDSDDMTGEVLSQVDASGVSRESMSETVHKLQGELELQVPSFSAIKQNGKKLYQRARNKEDFVPPVRKMTFRQVDLLESGPSWLDAEILCSKGTYIRSWAKAVGADLEVGGTVETLRRTVSLPYKLEQAKPLEALLEKDPEDLASLQAWVPLADTLPHWPEVEIEGKEEKLVVNGQIPRRLERYLEIQYGRHGSLSPGIKLLSRRSGHLLSLLSHESPLNFKIRRVFPPS